LDEEEIPDKPIHRPEASVHHGRLTTQEDTEALLAASPPADIREFPEYDSAGDDDGLPPTLPRPIKRRLSTYASTDGGVDLEDEMAGSARR